MRTKEIWSQLPDRAVIQSHLNEFYRFMYERHSIWYRRFVLRTPPPWTKDPILRDHRFTNVYRELDRGTIYYLDTIWPRAKQGSAGEQQRNVLWHTIIYRLVNRVETFQKCPILHCWSWSLQWKWFRSLEKLHEQESIFTSAHITLPVGVGNKMSRLQKLKIVLQYTHRNLAKLSGHLRTARSLEEAFHILRRIPCVGPFIAYEICCDLMYVKYLPFGENDWVNAGPGCKLGIRLIWPKTKGDREFQSRIRWLEVKQVEYFKRLHLRFPYFYKHKTLTLRSIEHSLCEYSKYYRMKHTKAGKVRLFKPQDWPNASGQLPFRFPREK
jgi:hypothetical protein